MFSKGDFVYEYLVTDTVVYEVIKTTAKTITIRNTVTDKSPEGLAETNGASYPTVWQYVEPNPWGTVKTLRLRKDGTFRTADWASALHPARTINGHPVTKTDYSF